MKRIFSSSVFALAAGLCLRLFFVLKFPADSGDTALYEEIAANWLKRHMYAINVNGALVPVDVRMPGYPAFLAFIYAITGRTGEAARMWVMLAQVGVDIIGCVFVAWLAGFLLVLGNPRTSQKPVLRAAWWLAMLCPFTSNYTAVPLTETFAIALTSMALVFFVSLTASADAVAFPKPANAEHQFGDKSSGAGQSSNSYRHWAIPAGILPGLLLGVATLFRPESPLLLLAAWIVTAWQLLPKRRVRAWLHIVAYSGIACVLPLIPWTIRNAITFHELQLLTPKYSTLPGEIVPYGFMAWEKTWLYRMRDCYAVPWKLNEEQINVDEIPARAFDSPQEKQRVAAILAPYNEDLTLTQDEDDSFAQLARERAARHPLRTHLWIPALRAVVIWFSPRIELLPISGDVFPLAQKFDEDPADQAFTILLFLLNIVYVALALCGATKLWRSPGNADLPIGVSSAAGSFIHPAVNDVSASETKWRSVRPALVFLLLFLLLRTAFLTTLETPEPRYVLVCFPIVIALAAQFFAGKSASIPPA